MRIFTYQYRILEYHILCEFFHCYTHIRNGVHTERERGGEHLESKAAAIHECVADAIRARVLTLSLSFKFAAPLTRTGKSAFSSGKKHRRKRHSALCCGHYLFRGIVKAVVIGGRRGVKGRGAGREKRGRRWRAEDVWVGTHAQASGAGRGRGRRRGTSAVIGEPRLKLRRFSALP